MSETSPPSDAAFPFHEEVELAGHIIDSLILPKVLDEIIALGGSFDLRDVRIGKERNDPSYTRVLVSAPTAELLEEILTEIGHHGAASVDPQDCQLELADIAGTFPERFYSTTNQDTEVRMEGDWIPVAKQEMDCGIRVNPETKTAECVPMSDVQVGDSIVVGRAGTRVKPTERDTTAGSRDAFSFMHSTVSSEKPKGVTVREIAKAMRKAKQGNGKILLVGGPAIVHTGSREHFSWLIKNGYVNVLFAGNALATHDIEQSFFDT
ncbi:MAG: TIGR00300 family protein, partial [Planctomycetaceae bacterium]|nr:TIGR00300 family protein [Planctomycetaceae bacterium]